jgi:hypothetical protein
MERTMSIYGNAGASGGREWKAASKGVVLSAGGWFVCAFARPSESEGWRRCARGGSEILSPGGGKGTVGEESDFVGVVFAFDGEMDVPRMEERGS